MHHLDRAYNMGLLSSLDKIYYNFTRLNNIRI